MNVKSYRQKAEEEAIEAAAEEARQAKRREIEASRPPSKFAYVIELYDESNGEGQNLVAFVTYDSEVAHTWMKRFKADWDRAAKADFAKPIRTAFEKKWNCDPVFSEATLTTWICTEMADIPEADLIV